MRTTLPCTAYRIMSYNVTSHYSTPFHIKLQLLKASVHVFQLISHSSERRVYRQRPHLEIVGVIDSSVVNHCHSVAEVEVRVSVLVCLSSVCGPSSVSDAHCVACIRGFGGRGVSERISYKIF